MRNCDVGLERVGAGEQDRHGREAERDQQRQAAMPSVPATTASRRAEARRPGRSRDPDAAGHRDQAAWRVRP